MAHSDIEHSDPSKSSTINFYLREGRRQRSCEAWNLIYAIGRIFEGKGRREQPLQNKCSNR